jgi:hypothetical protein
MALGVTEGLLVCRSHQTATDELLLEGSVLIDPACLIRGSVNEIVSRLTAV